MFICLALVYGVKEKVFMTLVKDHKADYSRETITMGFCSMQERLDSTPNITKKSENL